MTDKDIAMREHDFFSNNGHDEGRLDYPNGN